MQFTQAMVEGGIWRSMEKGQAHDLCHLQMRLALAIRERIVNKDHSCALCRGCLIFLGTVQMYVPCPHVIIIITPFYSRFGR